MPAVSLADMSVAQDSVSMPQAHSTADMLNLQSSVPAAASPCAPSAPAVPAAAPVQGAI